MYCPICGDEFRDGITRCSEHDVDLVEEPPFVEEPPPRWNDRVAVRVVFVIFLIAAVTYGISGFISGTIFAMVQLREWSYENAQLFDGVQSAMFPVALAAFGVLAGAALLRIYTGTGTPARVLTERADLPGSISTGGPIGLVLMRVLFALTVLFALLWAGTRVAMSGDHAEFMTRFGTPTGFEEPGDTFATLLALNYGAYSAGVACLTIMGAGVLVGIHQRLRGDSNDGQDDPGSSSTAEDPKE